MPSHSTRSSRLSSPLQWDPAESPVPAYFGPYGIAPSISWHTQAPSHFTRTSRFSRPLPWWFVSFRRTWRSLIVRSGGISGTDLSRTLSNCSLHQLSRLSVLVRTTLFLSLTDLPSSVVYRTLVHVSQVVPQFFFHFSCSVVNTHFHASPTTSLWLLIVHFCTWPYVYRGYPWFLALVAVIFSLTLNSLNVDSQQLPGVSQLLNVFSHPLFIVSFDRTFS